MPERRSYVMPLQFDSMDGKITLRKKVQRAKDAVEKHRAQLAGQLKREAEGSARLAIRLVEESGRLEEEPASGDSWGTFGASQGNVGKHLDAISAQIHVLREVLLLLDEVLEKDSA